MIQIFLTKGFKFLLPLYPLLLLLLLTHHRILPPTPPHTPNTFCLSPNLTTLDSSICTHLRFSQVLLIYTDGLPYYIAQILSPAYPQDLISLSIDNPGIPDSGPVYRNFITGRLSYYYTGSLEKIDNIWTQIKNAGQKIYGNGVGYPISTMTKGDVFSKWLETHNGISV